MNTPIISEHIQGSGKVFPKEPEEVGDLVCFWDFQEPAGELRNARGRFSAALREGAGPVRRAEGGVFGKHCAELARGQYFFIPHAECGGMDLDRELTMIAWIQRHRKPETQCEAIAGMWNETLAQRQYGLFLDLRIHGASNNAGGHISSTGGPTPGHPWCMEAAIGACQVGYSRWHSVAMSFDGREARVYLDGHFDARPGLNPLICPGSRLHRSNSDFTVGAVHRLGEMGNWFCGRMGGLAVYSRALSGEEIRSVSIIDADGVLSA